MPQSGTLPNLTGAFVDEGRLELITILGAGAHGKVYKARDTTASSPSFYAVKCLRRPKSNTDKDVIYARYQKREWSLHLRVSAHPNIVTVHRHFADSEHNFLVFDLSLGGDLHQAIVDGIYQGQTKLIKRTFTCIVDGVRFCHDRGVYHRDLKPENILVDLASGSVRIADFGLATTSKVSRGVGCGSSSYMAPESLACMSSSYRPQDNDVWALNIILINLISKMTPWHSACQCTADYRWNNFLTDFDFFRMFFPISVPLNDLLRRSFCVDPGQRPALMQLRHEVVAMPALYMS
ncbi:kinase-like domain-containing protein, partial [Mycena pura]